MQLHKGSRHLNPFTQIVWKRGRRRWMGLRSGRWVPIERPAPWLLGNAFAKKNPVCVTMPIELCAFIALSKTMTLLHGCLEQCTWHHMGSGAFIL